MNYLILDIETIPSIDVEAEAATCEISAPANYKDETKIAQYIEQKRSEVVDSIIKQASLSRVYGQIVCIGTILVIDNKIHKNVLSGSEHTILSTLSAIIEEYRPMFITYNGADFDIPFINFRSRLLFGEPIIPVENRYSGIHIDLYQEVAGYRPPAGVLSHGLKAVSEALGFEKTDDLDGSWVYAMWQAGEIDEIEKYCLQDCERTYYIAKKLGYLK